jgi:hypothetical protein
MDTARTLKGLALIVFAATLTKLAATELKGDSVQSGVAQTTSSVAAGETESHDPQTIKEVMRFAMTKGLCKKVIDNKASVDDQARLVALFEKLAAMKPPKGSQESWNEKTLSLLSAAKDVAEGKSAHKALAKAANCNACHTEHRPK